jgi:hypothetical protein
MCQGGRQLTQERVAWPNVGPLPFHPAVSPHRGPEYYEQANRHPEQASRDLALGKSELRPKRHEGGSEAAAHPQQAPGIAMMGGWTEAANNP